MMKFIRRSKNWMATSLRCHPDLLKKMISNARIAALLALLSMVGGVMPVRAETGVFELPKPGTYKLGKITKFPNAWVLETSKWQPRRLASFTSGKITLFTFFYSTCRDAEGCPAVWSTYNSLHGELLEDDALRGKVRLVFLSLDPQLDTPKTLQVFAAERRDTHHQVPWHFLTTWSEWFLAPILKGLEQSAARDLDSFGRPLLTISHQVKFYLVDEQSWVREIYTSNFISPEVVLNDIRTLLMASQKVEK